jgi:hypothetical protein
LPGEAECPAGVLEVNPPLGVCRAGRLSCFPVAAGYAREVRPVGGAHTPPGVAVKMPAGDPTPRRASSCRAEQMRPTHAACQATWVGLAVLDLMGMRNGRAGYISGAQRPADPSPGEQRGTREAATAYAAASA